MDSGMETAMIKVLRQLPGRAEFINPVRQAAMTASRITPFTEPRTKNGLIGERQNLQFRRERLCDPWKKAANAFHDVDGRSVAGLEDGTRAPR